MKSDYRSVTASEIANKLQKDIQVNGDFEVTSIGTGCGKGNNFYSFSNSQENRTVKIPNLLKKEKRYPLKFSDIEFKTGYTYLDNRGYTWKVSCNHNLIANFGKGPTYLENYIMNQSSPTKFLSQMRFRKV